jgi:hypothetical protein
MEKIIHKGKVVTLENITLEDIEELFEFDKTILLNHRLRLSQEYILRTHTHLVSYFLLIISIKLIDQKRS